MGTRGNRASGGIWGGTGEVGERHGPEEGDRGADPGRGPWMTETTRGQSQGARPRDTAGATETYSDHQAPISGPPAAQAVPSRTCMQNPNPTTPGSRAIPAEDLLA